MIVHEAVPMFVHAYIMCVSGLESSQDKSAEEGFCVAATRSPMAVAHPTVATHPGILPARE